jgi:hypothetical protein
MMIYAVGMKASSFALASLVLSASFAQAQSAPSKNPSGIKLPVLPQSESLTVRFLGKLTTLTLPDLLKLPQVSLKVHNPLHNTDESYGGPLVADVLAAAGLTASIDTEWAMLHSSLIATGHFNYFVVYSVAEVEPSYSTRQAIVAIHRSGGPNTEGGTIELVNTLDSNSIRWVRGLTNLTVIRQTPLK